MKDRLELFVGEEEESLGAIDWNFRDVTLERIIRLEKEVEDLKKKQKDNTLFQVQQFSAQDRKNQEFEERNELVAKILEQLAILEGYPGPFLSDG